MATEISAVISWHEVLHPDIGDRGKWNFPWHGTAGQCWERFVADGDTAGVSARRVISPTATAQHHSQATYLADGALGVKGPSCHVPIHRISKKYIYVATTHNTRLEMKRAKRDDVVY